MSKVDDAIAAIDTLKEIGFEIDGFSVPPDVLADIESLAFVVTGTVKAPAESIGLLTDKYRMNFCGIPIRARLK